MPTLSYFDCSFIHFPKLLQANHPRFELESCDTTQLSQDHLNVQKAVMKSSGRFPIIWWMEGSMKALWAIEMLFFLSYFFQFALDHFKRSGTLPAWIETLVLFPRSLGFGVLFSINQRVCRIFSKKKPNFFPYPPPPFFIFILTMSQAVSMASHTFLYFYL